VRQLSSRVLVVTCAAQRFLLDVLPLSDRGSPRVVDEFCEALLRYRVGRETTEGVIIAVLRKLEVAVGVSDQMVLSQYFAMEASTPDQCSRLKLCVERLIRTHATPHPCVAAALRMIEEYYQDHRFRLDVLAKRLRVSPSYLSHLISFHTGQRFRSHVRSVRMRAAASRFAEEGTSIQEVAAAVGYAHLADFDHHFKAHFGLTPSAYRAQLSMSGASTIRSNVERTRSGQQPASTTFVSGTTSESPPRPADLSGKAIVLIVEHDRDTRDAFGRILTSAGYDVAVAADTTTGRRLFQQHSPLVTLAGSVMKPASILAFVRRLRECCSKRQSLALVTVDPVLTQDQEQELVKLDVAVAFKPLLPREIVGLVGRLLVPAYR
jgi:AraC-like DNA-binding protein/CheY-like chemotaxis protein